MREFFRLSLVKREKNNYEMSIKLNEKNNNKKKIIKKDSGFVRDRKGYVFF